MKTMEIRVSLTSVLIVFIVLKLTGVISWSWLWVLSPFWIPLLVAGFFLVLFLLIMSFKN